MSKEVSKKNVLKLTEYLKKKNDTQADRKSDQNNKPGARAGKQLLLQR
jgi:hypothetical protein